MTLINEAPGPCIPALIHDLCGIYFPGLLYQRMILPGGHVYLTPERVVGDWILIFLLTIHGTACTVFIRRLG